MTIRPLGNERRWCAGLEPTNVMLVGSRLDGTEVEGDHR